MPYPNKSSTSDQRLEAPGIHPERFYTPQQAGELLCVSSHTLAGWRVQRRGPAFLKPTPKVVRYKGDALLAFITGGDDA